MNVGTTRHIDNTLNPAWDEVFETLVYSQNARLYFHVYDHNAVTKDVTLGQFMVRLWDIFPNMKPLNPIEGDLAEKVNQIAHQSLTKKHNDIKIFVDGTSADVYVP